AGYRFAKRARSEMPPTSMCMENLAYENVAGCSAHSSDLGVFNGRPRTGLGKLFNLNMQRPSWSLRSLATSIGQPPKAEIKNE
ncbi:hypothetical protein, partial [Rhizobium acidisoli]|uniref:hypothetical protein n=1 Tax=Rhizobium acidisoli TaxID=1538158 RepID=UPI001AEC1DA4